MEGAEHALRPLGAAHDIILRLPSEPLHGVVFDITKVGAGAESLFTLYAQSVRITRGPLDGSAQKNLRSARWAPPTTPSCVCHVQPQYGVVFDIDKVGADPKLLRVWASQCEQIGTKARTNGLVTEGAEHALTAPIGVSPFP